MSDSLLGFTRDEIIAKVLDSLGRSSDNTLKTRLQSDINLDQLDFWKETDWKFAYKNGVKDGFSIPLVNGTDAYTFITSGANFRGTDVDKIYITDLRFARTLTKVSLREIRQIDPARQMIGPPDAYALDKHDRFVVHPIPDATVATIPMYIDGKVLPTFMVNGTDYPSIPIEYQSTFIQYHLYKTCIRERDSRIESEKALYEDMVKKDKEHDLKEVESNLRIKFSEEELRDSGTYPGLYNKVRDAWGKI